MKTYRKIVLLLLAAGLLFTMPALADGGGDVEVRARELMGQGLKAEEAGDTEKARTAYLRSFELYPSFDVAGNLGLIEVKMQRFLDAAEHLSYCLQHYPTGENRELKKLLEENLAKAKSYVSEVSVTVEPGAEVFVDGESVGRSPMNGPFYVMAGKYTLRAEGKAGVAERMIIAEKGRSAHVALELSPLPDSGLPEEEVSSPPEAETGDPADEAPRAKRNWVPAYILGGVTVAAFGTSMVFRGLAGGKKKEIDDLDSDDDSRCGSAAQECSALADAIAARDNYVDVSTVALIATGAMAGATLGYVIYTLTKKPAPASVQATVGFGHHGATLLVGGQF